ncbi:MAG: hypothetical protein A3J54_01910 [Candidatus Ryanbacteria bacterium RIFCSPHIGHO2_02_FULL_45_13b]|uniref:Uncharacterized protein n=1 Tax=Candidatus Ryanbacteria bacterium RIFCSPHIGHO2_02_FULL_45_13b TaxID=1802117 RepID=A0A1G2G9L5_9BACT|nr:MAG: hypothetical protein A3J54_01910 [Candidatus Ryanbacteria bacterium RIFCSPHIGHO2_02_FULL_45_13b]
MQKGFGFIGILIVIAVIAGVGAFTFDSLFPDKSPFKPSEEEKSAIEAAEEMKNVLEQKNTETTPPASTSKDEKVLQIVDKYLATLNQQCESGSIYQQTNKFGDYADEIGAINPERYDSHARGHVEIGGKSFTIVYPLIEKNDSARGWPVDYQSGFGTHIAYIYNLGVHCINKKQYTDNCTLEIINELLQNERVGNLSTEEQYRYAAKKLECPDSFLKSFEFRGNEINYNP